tara:strand:- start:624 stop:1019 length:396 start_codon:yes stop_codon:yes gene_type:complete
MKQLKYNNKKTIKVSEQMLAFLGSEKGMQKAMARHELKYQNFTQLMRFLLVHYFENKYKESHLESWFEWSLIPEVQEYRFAQEGGYEVESRHYRDKIKKELDDYYQKRRKGEDLAGYEDLNQIKLPFDNNI